MKSIGNGTPKQCAENLLKCIRGEVPYERIKGLDSRLVDKPISEAEISARQDAEWLIETYEPRVKVNAINVNPVDLANGGFSITADVTEKEE